MKQLVILISLLCSSLWAQLSNNMDELISDTFIVGQFDTNAGTDTARLWVPRGHKEMFGCSFCKTEIRFSNGLKTIIHDDDIGYRLENVGDLNRNGIDDIAYCRDWYMGCRRTFQLYIITKGTWTEIQGMEFMACGDKRSLKSRIQMLNRHQIKLWGEEVDGTAIYKIIELK